MLTFCFMTIRVRKFLVSQFLFSHGVKIVIFSPELSFCLCFCYGFCFVDKNGYSLRAHTKNIVLPSRRILNSNSSELRPSLRSGRKLSLLLEFNIFSPRITNTIMFDFSVLYFRGRKSYFSGLWLQLKAEK